MAKSAVIRKFILGILPLVILMLGFNGYKALIRSGKKQRPVKIKLQPTQVKVITVQYQDVSTHLTGYGTVRGKREVLIIPEVEGKITSINPNFVSGKTVRRKEILFTVDTRATKIQIDKINAEISKLAAQIDTTNQEGVNIKRNLEIVTDHVKIAKRDLTRDEDLFRKSMVSEQQVDASLRNYLQERNSKINYENQLSIIPLKIQELNASLDVKRAERADAKLKLQKSVVKAPFNGIIFDESIEISQVVKAGQTVGTLVDVSKWEIPVDLNEKNIGHLSFEKFENVSPGKYPCTVFWETQRGSTQWKGYISRIEKIDETTRTVRVIVEVPNTKKSKITLAKGMFCKVILPGKSYTDVISIPAAALRNNETVYVSEKTRLQIKKIQVLQRFGETIVIGSGIAPADKVIISALPNPVIGMPLKERRQNYKGVNN